MELYSVLVESVYPRSGRGRPLRRVTRMLRIYLLQQWFNVSAPAAEQSW